MVSSGVNAAQASLSGIYISVYLYIYIYWSMRLKITNMNAAQASLSGVVISAINNQWFSHHE